MRAEELKTIVVIGAGIMGQQIAMNTDRHQGPRLRLSGHFVRQLPRCRGESPGLG